MTSPLTGIHPVQILAVEDSPTQLAQLVFTLEEAGYSVLTATNGREGLAAAKANTVDLVISDIMMPEMDGYTLCKALHADEALWRVPVILLTSLVDPQDVIHGLEAGASNFLRKPFDPAYLLSRIQHVLATAKARKTHAASKGVTIRFREKQYSLSQERLQLLDLLLSTYDDGLYQLPAADDLNGTRVLVVEDSPTQAETIRFVLEELGCQVLTASHGVQALEALQKTEVELVITDVMMPEMDGYDLCRAIRADERLEKVPIILLTSLSDPQDVIVGLEAGATSFIRKPFLEDYLAGRVRNLILSQRTRKMREAEWGIDIVFAGQLHTITADRMQMLDLLLSSYDNAVHQNTELARVRDELRVANEQLEAHGLVLEERVAQRTAALATEIEERKLAARELEESRLFNESLLRTVPFPMEVVDEQGNILFMNEKMRSLMLASSLSGGSMPGSEPNPLATSLDARCWRRFKDDEEQCTNCPLRRTIVLGETDSMEVGGILGGKTFEIVHTGMMFQGKRALLEIFNDVTERKLLQIRLAQSDRLSTMGALAAGVAHEINNPLSYVLYNIQSLSEDLPKLLDALQRSHMALRSHLGADSLDTLLGDQNLLTPAALEDLRARFNDALSGTIRIKDITRGLGTFSRVEKTEVVPVNLHQTIEHAIAIVFNEIKFRARLVKDFGVVPPVLASDGKLAQVFLNLLINAAQAIEEGHVEANEIRIRTWAQGDRVFAEVSDTGKGIDSEAQKKLFEPFFTTKPIGVGTGLGLSICKNIITGFGGKITFSSTPGKGTKFCLALPTLPSNYEAPRESHPEQAATPSRTRGRILVVDDEAGIRKAISHMLSKAHEVVTAASGHEAQALLRDDRNFDLIFCDLMMPKMSGMELHTWLCEQDPELAKQIVFITGGAFTQAASKYLAIVGNLRLEKPVETRSFQRLTDELVLAAKAKSRNR